MGQATANIARRTAVNARAGAGRRNARSLPSSPATASILMIASTLAPSPVVLATRGYPATVRYFAHPLAPR